MNKSIALLTFALAAQSLFAENLYWENPEMIGENKLPYHATLTLPSQMANDGETTSLNGLWSFKWSHNPDARPVDFYKPDYDVTGWDKIKVPGNWQTEHNYRQSFVMVGRAS